MSANGSVGSNRAALGLAGFLAGAGVTHFLIPRFYDEIVPRGLPGEARTYTYVSGVAELGVGTLVAIPRTRRFGALAAAGLFAAVFPANVQMALDWRDRSPVEKAVGYGRLPLQLPMIGWALRVRRSAGELQGGTR